MFYSRLFKRMSDIQTHDNTHGNSLSMLAFGCFSLFPSHMGIALRILSAGADKFTVMLNLPHRVFIYILINVLFDM